MDRSYHSNPDWLYSGDMNAAYGGIWIKHCGDYAEAYRISDLDSAIGFTGAVMIEEISVGLYAKSREMRQRIKSALAYYGWTISDILQFPTRAARRAAIWEALISYGAADSDVVETLQLEPDGPMSFDGWTANRRQTGGDVGGYVMAKYLD